MKMKKFKKLLLSLLLLVVVCLICSPFLVSCSNEIEGVNSTAIINLIFPNLWVFIATIFATVILISAIIWFLWKPMNKKLDERKKYIENEITEAENIKKEAFQAREQAKLELINAQSNASKIVRDANDKAENLYNELQNQARNSAYEIVKAAQEEVLLEKRELEEQTHKQILDIAFDAVTNISKHKITREENDKLVEEFINDLEKSKD